MTLLFLSASAVKAQDTATVYLPREVTVNSSDVVLDDVAIISGDNEIAQAAGAVSLGNFNRADQNLVLDRAVIMSRLSSEGISRNSFRITGAKRVTVNRKNKVIDSEKIIAGARRYLKNNFESSGWAELAQVGSCDDLTVGAGVGELELYYRLVSADENSAAVGVDIYADDEKLAERVIRFRGKYERRVAITKERVQTGEVLTPENVKIEKRLSDTPQSGGWREPFGMVARRDLAPGTELNSQVTGRAESPKVVERNERVVIKINTGGLKITAQGQALQQGRVGEQIWVRNSDSQKRLPAIVREDGSVEPVF